MPLEFGWIFFCLFCFGEDPQVESWLCLHSFLGDEAELTHPLDQQHTINWLHVIMLGHLEWE